MIRVPDGTLRVLVQGIRRIHLEETLDTDPYLLGRFVEVPDVLEESREVEALTRNVQNLFARIIGSSRTCPRSCSSRPRTSTTRARSATSSPPRSASRPTRSSGCSRRRTSRSACATSRAS
jgi:Lon protease-like protein